MNWLGTSLFPEIPHLQVSRVRPGIGNGKRCDGVMVLVQVGRAVHQTRPGLARLYLGGNEQIGKEVGHRKKGSVWQTLIRTAS